MGPAPPVARVRRAVRAALGGLAVDRALLVACSGGPDSLALAAALAFEAPRAGRSGGAVVVDHGLQPGSGDIAHRAADLVCEMGLQPVHVVPVAVSRQGSPEAAARSARYAALEQVAAAAGDAYVLLGHTRDDQAESVLLGLGRGSGPRSIAGMRPVHGRYVRPLLRLDRHTTRAACVALALPFWDDPHNDDSRFRRARLRGEALPLLEDILGGGVAAALARTADQVRSDNDALDALAQAHLREALGPLRSPHQVQGVGLVSLGPLDVVPLAAMPGALRARILRLWALTGGTGPLSAVHIDALDALCTNWRGQGPIDLPGATVARRSGRLHLNRSS